MKKEFEFPDKVFYSGQVRDVINVERSEQGWFKYIIKSSDGTPETVWPKDVMPLPDRIRDEKALDMKTAKDVWCSTHDCINCLYAYHREDITCELLFYADYMSLKSKEETK